MREIVAPHSDEPIIVVSGLPRSGTSLMMQMLEAGGVRLVADEQREADEDNPHGYHEFERVKSLDKGDIGWLPQARGCAVKVISALLQNLPASESYLVLFMRREMREILASQRKMLERRGEVPDKIDDARLRALFEKHLKIVEAWLAEQPNLSVLYVDFNAMLAAPEPALAAVDRFLGRSLDLAKMASAISPSLYRNRA